MAMENARRFFPELPVEYADDAVDLAQGCDAIVVVTDWDEYRRLPLKEMRQTMRGNMLMDARNLLHAEEANKAGFEYVGIGR